MRGLLPVVMLLVLAACGGPQRADRIDCRSEPERGTFEVDPRCCEDNPGAWGCPDVTD